MNAETPSDEKIIAIPKDKYIKITYLLLLLSSLVGILNGFLSIISGITIASALGSLAGLVGLVFAILGLFVFKDKFNATQQSHFKYVGTLFLIFFALGIVLGAVLSGLGYISIVLALLLSIASFICMFAGFRLNEKNAVADKEAVINELKSLKP